MLELRAVLLGVLSDFEQLQQFLPSPSAKSRLLEMHEQLHDLLLLPLDEGPLPQPVLAEIIATRQDLAELCEKARILPAGQLEEEVLQAAFRCLELLRSAATPSQPSQQVAPRVLFQDSLVQRAAPLGLSPPVGHCPRCGEEMSQCTCPKP
jgi:hypothetical protein